MQFFFYFLDAMGQRVMNETPHMDVLKDVEVVNIKDHIDQPVVSPSVTNDYFLSKISTEPWFPWRHIGHQKADIGEIKRVPDVNVLVVDSIF